MNSNDIRALERITFFPGQRLQANDLSDVQDVDRHLRWLHNRSLHAWGIGIGLGVIGEAGESAVQIEPGYGIDCIGREIILTEPRVKPIPAVAGDQAGKAVEFFLVAAYQDDADQAVRERRRGVCLPDGTVRLGEEPLLEWKKRGKLREGFELVLAQVWILNCRLNRPVSLVGRRSARPSDAPYVATGQTTTGATEWTSWVVGGVVLGVAVDVDTSPARFRTTPHLTAHVVGERILPGTPPFLAIGLPTITARSPEQFTLSVVFPSIGASFNPPSLLNPTAGPGIVKKTLKWSVAWMGVEG